MSEGNANEPNDTTEELLPRIAVVCLSGNHGGMEINARVLASRLSEWSEYCILIVRQGTWLEECANQFGLNFVSVSMPFNFSLLAAHRIRQALRIAKIEVMVYFGSSEMKTLRFSLSPMLKQFMVRHGTHKRSSKKDIVHRFLWSKVSSHWAVSESIKNNVKDIYPTDGKKFFVNYTGQGEKLRVLPNPLSIHGDKMHIAHIGRIEREKGQFDVLSVLKNLLDQGLDAEVSFFGSGRSFNELWDAAADAGLLSHINFAGQVDRPYTRLGFFNIFLYPSYGEGFGNSFTEAISSGIHCFCYDNTCFPEYRALGFKYRMVRTGDVQALTDAVLDVWNRKEPQPLENREVAVRHFSDEAEMSRLREALSDRA
jgi:glycosyltransferase involved in cell wall biosynthesis